MKYLLNRIGALVVFFSTVLWICPAGAINVGEVLKLGDLVTVQGKQITEAQLKGKYVVVQVWATWCPYCHRQNGNLKELVRRTQGGHLEVVGLSIDKTSEVVLEYAQKNDINFPLVMMTPGLSKQIGVRRGVPELYVIDPTGTVIQKDYGQMVDLDIFDLARFSQR